VDVLDRILDKGLVVVGDIKISLAEIELITLKIRLLVCSVDKAEEIGINWWRFDPDLTVSRPHLPDRSLGEGEEASPSGLASETGGKTAIGRRSGASGRKKPEAPST